MESAKQSKAQVNSSLFTVLFYRLPKEKRTIEEIIYLPNNKRFMMYMQGERENKKNRKKMFYQVFIYFSYIFWDLGSATCLQKTGYKTGFSVMSSKYEQVTRRFLKGRF